MRKHDVRKWLHAILDLLPVILIPVFMIYSHRHEINDGSIQVQEKIAVDFNQLIGVESSERVYNGVTLDFDNQTFIMEGSSNSSGNTYLAYSNAIDFVNNHVYLVKTISSYETLTGTLSLYINYPYQSFPRNGLTRFTFNVTNSDNLNQRLWLYFSSNFSATNLSFTQNIFDLTQMFGAGNEPTNEEFDTYFNNFYPYVLSHKELIDGDLVTLNDTDIMSQFTYQLYNSVDKYFNMGNVFHLNEVYDWFNLNIFNGQASIYIFIVYQIVLYELIMDLLMLLYSLFMWFIDMIEKLMEKPLNSIK